MTSMINQKREIEGPFGIVPVGRPVRQSTSAADRDDENDDVSDDDSEYNTNRNPKRPLEELQQSVAELQQSVAEQPRVKQVKISNRKIQELKQAIRQSQQDVSQQLSGRSSAAAAISTAASSPSTVMPSIENKFLIETQPLLERPTERPMKKLTESPSEPERTIDLRLPETEPKKIDVKEFQPNINLQPQIVKVRQNESQARDALQQLRSRLDLLKNSIVAKIQGSVIKQDTKSPVERPQNLTRTQEQAQQQSINLLRPLQPLRPPVSLGPESQIQNIRDPRVILPLNVPRPRDLLRQSIQSGQLGQSGQGPKEPLAPRAPQENPNLIESRFGHFGSLPASDQECLSHNPKRNLQKVPQELKKGDRGGYYYEALNFEGKMVRQYWSRKKLQSYMAGSYNPCITGPVAQALKEKRDRFITEAKLERRRIQADKVKD